MAHVSFPSHHSSGGEDEDTFYSSTFDPSSSFQMNPMSAHPPRTPRSSVIASSQVYATQIYEPSEKEHVASDEESVDEQDVSDPIMQAERRVLPEQVLCDMVLTSNGRDKAFKLIQYTLRFYLLFHSSITNSRLLRTNTPLWERAFVKRLDSTASGLSFSRKTLLLFNWLSPLTAAMAQESKSYVNTGSSAKSGSLHKPLLHTVLHAPPPVLLELLNAVSDDVYTLSLLGLVGKRTGERAGRFSDWCWLISTLVGLVENGVERQIISSQQETVEARVYQDSLTGATAKSRPNAIKADDLELARLQKQDFWLQMTRVKLAMDLIFVSYDLFKLKRAKETVKTSAALISAVLSCAKLFTKHRSAIAKTLVR